MRKRGGVRPPPPITPRPMAGESGKRVGLCGGSEIWLMEPAVEDSGADLEQAVCADR